MARQLLYLRAHSMYKLAPLIIVLAFTLFPGCTASQTSLNGSEESGSTAQLANTFAIPQQKAAPQHIQSIQLYKKGSVQNAPIIQLNSSDQIVLEFDQLGEGSQQFKVRVSHRNKNWSESSLSPNFYLSGFNETYFSGGLTSFSQRPAYRHYSFEFPNSQLSFKVSGNYLLHIYEYQTDELLFSLPFFVTENKGDLKTRIEPLFVQREDLRAEDQLFSRYSYPEFVEFPQFDLSFKYSQNQFWGRSKTAEYFDTASPEEVQFHLGREDAFLRNYEFNTIDLRGLDTDGERILEVDQSTIPPRITLQRDIQAFTPSPRFFPDSRFGLPTDERNASYANVQFSLEPSDPLPESKQIYLVGDFNNWTINELNRMRYEPDSGLWEGSAFIKEGAYAYKYVLLQNGNIEDLALDQGFLFGNQSYTTFVYFRDPSRNYDRLLKAHQIRQR